MQTWINFLRGSVRVEVTGAFPERFINLCAQRGIGFWELEWVDEHTVRLRVARRDRKRLPALAERVQCELREVGRMGVPFFLARFRTRYALLAGLTLSILAVMLLSRFVLTVEISGNERVPAEAILWELRKNGVQAGTYGPSIDRRIVEQKVLLALPELSWLAVNLHGTRAEVLVRERDAPPEVVDRSTPADVVSTATGIITRIEVLSGASPWQAGDTVLEGETLISGVVKIEGAAYSDIDLGVRLVHAEGRVYARTWRTLTAQIPLQAEVKCYTGEEKRLWSLTFFGHRLNFSTTTGISFPKYDKISESSTLTLPNGQMLPLTLERTRCRAYETVPAPLDAAAAQTLLEARLRAELDALMQEREGEALRTECTARQEGGMLVVTLLAECEEQIGRTVVFAENP